MVAHLCDRVAIMQNGGFVEAAAKAQLLKGTVAHPYTRTLIEGSKGYVGRVRLKSVVP